jgi:hypothetical protein
MVGVFPVFRLECELCATMKKILILLLLVGMVSATTSRFFTDYNMMKNNIFNVTLIEAESLNGNGVNITNVIHAVLAENNNITLLWSNASSQDGRIISLESSDSRLQVNLTAAQNNFSSYLPLTGGIMTGSLNIGYNTYSGGVLKIYGSSANSTAAAYAIGLSDYKYYAPVSGPLLTMTGANYIQDGIDFLNFGFLSKNSDGSLGVKNSFYYSPGNTLNNCPFAPGTSNTYDIGAAAKGWKVVYAYTYVDLNNTDSDILKAAKLKDNKSASQLLKAVKGLISEDKLSIKELYPIAFFICVDGSQVRYDMDCMGKEQKICSSSINETEICNMEYGVKATGRNTGAWEALYKEAYDEYDTRLAILEEKLKIT